MASAIRFHVGNNMLDLTAALTNERLNPFVTISGWGGTWGR
jgi:hypothetical protein